MISNFYYTCYSSHMEACQGLRLFPQCDVNVMVIYVNEAILLIDHWSLCAGLKELGNLLLSKFKWGKTFFDINRDILDLYAACTTSTDVVAAQKRHLEELERSDRMHRDRGLITF